MYSCDTSIDAYLVQITPCCIRSLVCTCISSHFPSSLAVSIHVVHFAAATHHSVRQIKTFQHAKDVLAWAESAGIKPKESDLFDLRQALDEVDIHACMHVLYVLFACRHVCMLCMNVRICI